MDTGTTRTKPETTLKCDTVVNFHISKKNAKAETRQICDTVVKIDTGTTRTKPDTKQKCDTVVNLDVQRAKSLILLLIYTVTRTTRIWTNPDSGGPVRRNIKEIEAKMKKRVLNLNEDPQRRLSGKNLQKYYQKPTSIDQHPLK